MKFLICLGFMSVALAGCTGNEDATSIALDAAGQSGGQSHRDMLAFGGTQRFLTADEQVAVSKILRDAEPRALGQSAVVLLRYNAYWIMQDGYEVHVTKNLLYLVSPKRGEATKAYFNPVGGEIFEQNANGGYSLSVAAREYS